MGNSGRLRQEQNAKIIDAHDVVIRFNQGRTQGFEKFVGKKSTFRMFNGAYVGPKQGGEITIAQVRLYVCRVCLRKGTCVKGCKLLPRCIVLRCIRGVCAHVAAGAWVCESRNVNYVKRVSYSINSR